MISAAPQWRIVHTHANSEIQDCNDLPIFSVGYTYDTTLNAPTAIGGAHVLTYGINDDYKVQLAIQHTSGELYTRGKRSTTWTVWKKYQIAT